jgi:hypothetical protein
MKTQLDDCRDTFTATTDRMKAEINELRSALYAAQEFIDAQIGVQRASLQVQIVDALAYGGTSTDYSTSTKSR